VGSYTNYIMQNLSKPSRDKRYCSLTEGRLASYNRASEELYKEIVSQGCDN
jgi:hypothetical protein